MSASQELPGVRVAVTGHTRLFEDLLVASLQRRGIVARSGSDEGGRDDPDVVLVDERLIPPERNGARCVLMVRREDPATMRLARHVGASACVPVGSTLDHLSITVMRAANGEDLLTSSTRFDSERSLTSREIDVLRLMAAGHDNAAIAQALDISPHTARTHVQRILAKFDVRSRFSAVSMARGRGLLRSET